jgi:hypothetical protein
MTKQYAYFANASLDDGSEVVVDLEEHGWADKEMLSRTVRWALVPNGTQLTLTGQPYPLVQVAIPAGAKPVFRSRVFRAIITQRSSEQAERKVIPVLVHPEFRAYCIGWKKGRVHTWTWVLPNGAIEVTTDDDSHLGNVLRAHLNTIVYEVPEPEPEPDEDSTPVVPEGFNPQT